MGLVDRCRGGGGCLDGGCLLACLLALWLKWRRRRQHGHDWMDGWMASVVILALSRAGVLRGHVGSLA